MYCPYCGNKLDDGAKYCSNCGAEVQRPDSKFEPTTVAEKKDDFEFDFNDIPAANQSQNGSSQKQEQPKEDDSNAGAFGVLGFFVPIVGFILFALWRVERPERAKALLIGAIIGVVLSVVISIVYSIVVVAAGFAAVDFDSYYAISPWISILK